MTLKRMELEKLPLVEDKYPLLTTGHSILLQNLKTQGFLVADTDDKNANFDKAFAVTTNPLMNFACPRNMLTFEKYDSSCNDKVIKYGEKICLSTHSARLPTQSGALSQTQVEEQQSVARHRCVPPGEQDHTCSSA